MGRARSTDRGKNLRVLNGGIQGRGGRCHSASGGGC